MSRAHSKIEHDELGPLPHETRPRPARRYPYTVIEGRPGRWRRHEWRCFWWGVLSASGWWGLLWWWRG